MNCFGFEFEGGIVIMDMRLGNARDVSLGVMRQMPPCPVISDANLQVTITAAQARFCFLIVVTANLAGCGLRFQLTILHVQNDEGII